MPADIALWRSGNLEVFPNKIANQSASKLTQGRAEEICLMGTPQLQLVLIRRTIVSYLVRRFVLCLKYDNNIIFSENLICSCHRTRRKHAESLSKKVQRVEFV